MIVKPRNDHQCLDQVTDFARSHVMSPEALDEVRRLRTQANVIKSIRDKPQTDDDGTATTDVIKCDVNQRLRFLAPDPNCVERAADAMALFETMESLGWTPSVKWSLGTINGPVRHTGLCGLWGEHWYAVDLFPNHQRNASWADEGADGVRGFHNVVGKPVLEWWLGKSAGGATADKIGSGENALLGLISKKRPPTKQSTPPATSSAVAQRARPGATTNLSPKKQGDQRIGSNEERTQPANQRGGPRPEEERRRYDPSDREAEDRDDYGAYDDAA